MPTVRVFRNLTAGPKGKAPVYSIQAHEPGRGWRTVAHASQVLLGEVEFKVSAAGVARIRRTKKKTVVATVQGELRGWSGTVREHQGRFAGAVADRCFPAGALDGAEIGLAAARFNPYETDTFQLDGAPITEARRAFVCAAGVLVAA